MKQKKRKRRRDPNLLPPRPKLPDPKKFDVTRGQENDDQGEAEGMTRAIVTFDESLRRPPYREVLRDIDRLIRSNRKDGKA